MGNSDQSIRRNWVIIGTFTVIICIGIGLYFYNSFFRQSNAQLIETVPTDATFIFEVNDNRNFVNDVSPFFPYLNELLNLSSFSGFEFFMDQLEGSKSQFIISGHRSGDQYSILYSFRIAEYQFEELVEKLEIDPRNCTTFNESKIFVYGTHFKKFSFTYHDGVFSITEDLDLLKKSIVQLESTKNLLEIDHFSKLYKIVSKNKKQNWLIINNATFFSGINTFLNPDFQGYIANNIQNPGWSAYQIRFNDSEISMMGYSNVDEEMIEKLKLQPSQRNGFGNILPFNTHFYSTFNTSNPVEFLKQFKENKTYSISLENYSKLLPTTSTYFSLDQDSITYYFMAFKCDTMKTPIATILHPDSIVINQRINPYPIYASNLSEVYPHMNKQFKSEKLAYFIQYNGYLIFSSTAEALLYYLKVIPNNNIESSPYYRFAKSNLPSETSYEFFLASSTSKKWNKYLTEKSLKLNIAKDLKLITYSYAQPKDQLIGVNIFIKF
jgi:hypothetical protein